MSTELVATDALQVAAAAQYRIADCLSRSRNFLVEAGAGAGKTESLIEALRFLRSSPPKVLQRGRRVACITFTNVAKKEILARTDSDPRFFVATIHEFFWSVIQPFQNELREMLDPEKFEKALQKSEIENFSDQKVEYSLGYRQVNESIISIHHDDVPALAAQLLSRPKFVTRLKSEYPIVLIDEYQDTNGVLAKAIVAHCITPAKGPVFGFFGDVWQQIHPDSVGQISHNNLEVITKGTNFRSGEPVVRALNAMRPELIQALPSTKVEGGTHVFHTDQWLSGRVSGPHTQNDLNPELVDLALEKVHELLKKDGWDFSPDKTKTLILTHKSIAARQGYPQIENIFKNSDDFAKLKNPILRFLVEDVKVALDYFSAGHTGQVFEALGMKRPELRRASDKAHLRDALLQVMNETKTGTVGTVLTLLNDDPLDLPADVRQRLNELADLGEDEERSPRQVELETLLGVNYREIGALSEYIGHHSPYETKHGVKGSQFENVLILLGGGWNMYNFPRFLAYASDPSEVTKAHQAGYSRARNLFYVCASRPKTNLALLFTQQLNPAAHDVLESWFGAGNVHSLASPETI
ncbi:UvrD-helicase domain-containing protein [Glutamicibacter sp.]|uniref:UvrD-helicase domain-containing protein n=1 Tax=Glutamicibacter sp. TaxID=1931995 RepID=UPI002B458F29|nr:UvrD-helicase domain-containing protein [Glutamicibacter sp.]HJX79388.1 UvrD-helicase domain-containing protein [Glutamicibacter sp.]